MTEGRRETLDMTEGSPVKVLLFFAVPIILSNLFQQFYNIIDSLIVGNYLGTDALAAAGSAGTVTAVIVQMASGLALGASVVIAQYFGAGKKKEIRACMTTILAFAAAAGVLVTVFTQLLAGPILLLVKTPAEILEYSIEYLTVYFWGSAAIFLYNAENAVFIAMGDSRTPLYFLIVASVLNIGLDLFFVRVLHTGVAGAGIATIIAQLLAGVGSLLFAMLKNPFFRIEKKLLKADWDIIVQCVKIGVPLAMQTSLIAVSCIILQSVVNTFGSVVVAAYTATNRIEQLVQQPYNSLNMAMSTYTGQNMGAGKPERVRLGFRKGCLIMGIFSLLVLPFAQFGGEVIMEFFVNERDVIDFGAKALRITSWFYLALGMIYVTRGTLNGSGDAFFAFASGIVEMIGRICFARPLTKLPFLGVWGIWFATAFTWLLTAVFSLFRYYQRIGKRK